MADGIDFRKYVLPDPNNVFVARMHRGNLDVTIESSIAQGRLSGGAETVSSMARRYDQAINYWTASEDTNFETHQLPISFSGNRNNVVVAINGDYTYKDENNNPVWGIPARGQIHSSWYAKRFTNLESGSGFVWKRDRSVFIGECIVHPYPPKEYPDLNRKQIVTYYKTGVNQLFNGINVPRGNDDFIIYTPQYDKETLTDGTGIEVLVELHDPFLIRPEPSMITGVIKAIYDGVGSNFIPFDHVVLSASGVAKDEMLEHQIEIGDEIGISQEIRHLEENCETPLNIYDWTHTYASIGGSYYFLKDGEVRGYFHKSQAIVRHPRTAVAYDDDFIYFIIVDGRNPGISRGMTIYELGVFTKYVLGVNHAIAQDGGGSSTMVVNGEVVNNTFCNNVFCKANIYLPLVQKSLIPQNQQIENTDYSKNSTELINVLEPLTNQLNQVSYELMAIQRLVPNGLMMVVVEPMEKIERFSPGDEVVTISDANIRLGPGTNYSFIATVRDRDLIGTIVAHTNQLDGVFAKGYYWWKVSFMIDGKEVVGWMADSLLADPEELNAQYQELIESKLR
ncbi:MAG: phosphodiester glycosidase family protein [Anaerolineales bacterium]|nr:phosphodiester glycosidase family protein [Anaerolineales bacterium]